jgi:REP-associated tyrosine transposase
MPRAPRHLLASGRFFHLYARGVDSMVIFRDRDDRLEFMRLLAITVHRHDWRCHAFCLMDTHAHLVAEAALADISSGMHSVLGRYATHFNRRHERHGHLFGERYGARLIESERAFWAVVGYVLDNPVRAGMVGSHDEWPWCGAAHLSGRPRHHPATTRKVTAGAGRLLVRAP